MTVSRFKFALLGALTGLILSLVYITAPGVNAETVPSALSREPSMGNSAGQNPGSTAVVTFGAGGAGWNAGDDGSRGYWELIATELKFDGVAKAVSTIQELPDRYTDVFFARLVGVMISKVEQGHEISMEDIRLLEQFAMNHLDSGPAACRGWSLLATLRYYISDSETEPTSQQLLAQARAAVEEDVGHSVASDRSPYLPYLWPAMATVGGFIASLFIAGIGEGLAGTIAAGVGMKVAKSIAKTPEK
ncbi:hypothetical protein [Stratiformator vulcanicus]|uniref:Uncharacterized protein n=1 Tax=Stratiformator vulcanicus TaxID=2527980 RepID=A0A517QWD3_9PLAN|nr:hypothetical protein [Stratiformator vulcanicus]QDT35880.1 hypothetical protein Pan189_02330 [Stratiformator vulcanicus]